MEAELITASIHMESDATPLNEWCESRFIALSPRGVAALPIPKKLAVIFMAMAPQVSVSFLHSGNSRDISKANTLETTPVRPLDSAIFIIPVHSAITPEIPMASVTPVCAPSHSAAHTLPVVPFEKDMINDMTIIPDHM